MGVSYVGQVGEAFDAGVSATTMTVTTSTATEVGTYLVLASRSGLSSPVSAVSDTAGNTWAKVNNNASNTVCSVWSCFVTTQIPAASTITITYTVSNGNKNAGVWAFRGLNRPVITSATAQGSGTTGNTRNLTPSRYASLLLSVAGVQNNSTFTQPTGFTKLPLTTSSIHVNAAYRIQPGVGSSGTTWTWTVSGTFGIVSSTLTPDGGDFLAVL